MSERTSIWNNPPTGFRVMWWDPLAILLCALAVWWLWPQIGHWGLIMPFVLGTFFLFCNVFRVRRSYELWWAAIFLVNAVAWLSFVPSLWGIVSTQSAVTVVFIGLEIRSERYRGIGSFRTE